MGDLVVLKKYGDCVTLDHFIRRGEMSEGIKKEQDAVVMLDRFSDHMAIVPVRDNPRCTLMKRCAIGEVAPICTVYIRTGPMN